MKTLLTYLWLRLFFPRSRSCQEWEMLVLLNQERRKAKLPSLRMEQDLRQVARMHSQDMAVQGYFSHTNQQQLSPSDRIAAANISDSSTGENLAYCRGYRHPVAQSMKGLMTSPGHRANILRPQYTGVGIGLFVDDQDTSYFTQNFVTRVFAWVRAPRKLLMGHRFRIHGRARSNKPISLLLQIHRYDQVIHSAPLSCQGNFRFTYTPTQTGTYTCAIFLMHGTKGQLINSWTFRVYGSWLTRLFSR